MRPLQTGQIDSKLVSHDGLLKKGLCIQRIIGALSRGMDKVPAWSVVRDKAQVSRGGGNMKCHLRIHGVVTHRNGAIEVKISKSHLSCWEKLYGYQKFHRISVLNLEVGVHWSSSVEIKAATVLGQLPVSGVVAGQVLRQHLCKFSAFAWI